jgi:hypothetical protein
METSLLLKSNSTKSPVLAQIAEIVLDASIEETHEFKSKVTQFPVEDGSTISDNIYNEPEHLTMHGLVTNNPLPRPGEAVYGDSENAPLSVSRAEATLFQLMKIRQSRTPIAIVTGLMNYSNMVMTSLSIPRDAAKGNAINFTAEFTKINIVSTASVPASALKAVFGIHKQVAKKENQGQQTPKQPTDAQKKKPQSFLRSLAPR